MRRCLKAILPTLKRALALSLPLAATLKFKQASLFMDSRSLYDKITEENLNSVDASQDTVFVLNLDDYVDDFKRKVLGALIELKEQNPNLRIYSINVALIKERPELFGAIDERTVLLIKRKGDSSYSQLDLKTMYFDTSKLFTFYQDFPTVANINDLKLTKFDYLFGYCDNSDKGVRLFRELAMDENFRENNFHIVNLDCSKVEGTPADLFVLKKHSKVNSFDDNNVLTVDQRTFDYKKSKNFFNKDEKGNAESLFDEITRLVDAMSVFTPLELHERMNKNYSAKLTIDENKITKRERFELLHGVKEIKSRMSKDQRKEVNFYVAPGNLNEVKSELLVTDELKFNLRASYATQSIPLETSKMLREKYPFLDRDDQTFLYKYDLEKDELNFPKFKAFFDKVAAGEMPQYCKSEPSKYHKISEKLVFNNFQRIYKDGKDHIVMFYSKKCHSCKQIGPIFEQIALANISQSYFGDLEFNRVNGDLNSFFDHTPIIAYFKKGYQNPFIFNVDIFTLEGLLSFISNTRAIEIQDSSSQSS